ncbi:methyltransferase domain-containing protein [Aurantimonas sp. A2-1-M11]|uniref:class I SAM-dependent methyltransferase n=1 Tax=Aurantimonas sp. A2-1-M11 TaxID=3113712 RepID=UPI002F9443EF
MTTPMAAEKHPAVAGYDRIADRFEEARRLKGWEPPFFAALADELGPGARLLDCGCGTGHAGLAHLVAAGVAITGLDGSAAMLAHFQKNYPQLPTVLGDMRTHVPAELFEAIVAWDSFFHLDHTDQAAMLGRFATWLRPGGLLLFTSGPSHSAIRNTMFDEPFAYASYSDAGYRVLLAEAGFTVRLATFDEPQGQIHKVWMAQKS